LFSFQHLHTKVRFQRPLLCSFFALVVPSNFFICSGRAPLFLEFFFFLLPFFFFVRSFKYRDGSLPFLKRGRPFAFPYRCQNLPCPFARGSPVRCSVPSGWFVSVAICFSAVPSHPQPRRSTRAWYLFSSFFIFGWTRALQRLLPAFCVNAPFLVGLLWPIVPLTIPSLFSTFLRLPTLPGSSRQLPRHYWPSKDRNRPPLKTRRSSFPHTCPTEC